MWARMDVGEDGCGRGWVWARRDAALCYQERQGGSRSCAVAELWGRSEVASRLQVLVQVLEALAGGSSHSLHERVVTLRADHL